MVPNQTLQRGGAGHCWAGSLQGFQDHLVALMGISTQAVSMCGNGHVGSRCCPEAALGSGVAPSGCCCIWG
jgi:hypothetical protein